MFVHKISSAALAVLALTIMALWNPAAPNSEFASFKGKVFPILKTYCVDCHLPGQAGYAYSGLDMSSYESLMKGTKFGPVVTPGDAFTSNLMVLIDGRLKKNLMPPHNSFQRGPSSKERGRIRAWIINGAKNDKVFRDVVYPLLQEHCFECHQEGGKGFKKSGLDMTTYASLMKGTTFGPVVIPGDAMTSNLMALMEGRASASLKMPHSELQNMSRREKQLIRIWINAGAVNN